MSKTELALQLPHGDELCLIDAVHIADESAIECSSGTHLHPDHPFEVHGRVPWCVGVEMAGQAMALHGAYLATAGVSNDPTETAVVDRYVPVVKVIVALRGVEWHVDYLDELLAPINISAALQMANDKTAKYSFELNCDGHRVMAGNCTLTAYDQS